MRRERQAPFVRLVAAISVILAPLVAGGYATFGYYAQAVGGQFELARSSRPVRHGNGLSMLVSRPANNARM